MRRDQRLDEFSEWYCKEYSKVPRRSRRGKIATMVGVSVATKRRAKTKNPALELPDPCKGIGDE